VGGSDTKPAVISIVCSEYSLHLENKRDNCIKGAELDIGMSTTVDDY